MVCLLFGDHYLLSWTYPAPSTYTRFRLSIFNKFWCSMILKYYFSKCLRSQCPVSTLRREAAWKYIEFSQLIFVYFFWGYSLQFPKLCMYHKNKDGCSLLKLGCEKICPLHSRWSRVEDFADVFRNAN